MGNNIKLEDQLPDEVVIRIVRRDIMVLIKRLFSFAVVVLVLVGGIIIFFNTFPEVAQGSLYPILLLLGFGLGLFAWLFFFLSITDFVWLTNNSVVTIRY